jgi:phosphopantetheinyl transferase (holo-ACP synthase)
MIVSISSACRPREASISEHEARSGVVAALKLLRVLAFYYLRFMLEHCTPPFRRVRHIELAPAELTPIHISTARQATPGFGAHDGPGEPVGVAVHALSISRLERLYAIYGERFARRVLTEAEFMRCSQLGTRSRVLFIARCLCARKAAATALGNRLGQFPADADRTRLSLSRVADLLFCVAVVPKLDS